MLIEYNDCLMASVNKGLDKAIKENRDYWEHQQEQETKKLERQLVKKGMTKEEYEAVQEQKRMQAKKKRYEKEIIELEDRLAYLKKWIAEHNAD